MRHERQDLVREYPLLPQPTETEGIIPFRKPLAALVNHQRAMIKGRRFPCQCLIQEDLPGGGQKKIAPAHHLGDPHQGVISYDG